jgi:hypothetical protein
MLDVYQVSGIVRQGRFEYIEKFEKEYPDIVNFLTEPIHKAAAQGEVDTKIHASKYKNQVYDIKKYLIYKGFYVDITGEFIKTIGNDGLPRMQSDFENKPVLTVKWPK